MAQQYFTIPSTGVYGTYKFYENDQIPMELAVELGIAGAALTEGNFFSSEERTAIYRLMNPLATVKAGRSINFASAYGGTATTGLVYDNSQVIVPLGRLVGSFDQAAIDVTSAAVASSVLRLATVQFSDTAAGIQTVTVLNDHGTVATDSLGVKTWTIDVTFDGTALVGYLLWSDGEPTVRGIIPTVNVFGTDDTNPACGAFYDGGIIYDSGALAATYTVTTSYYFAPRVDFRVS